MRKELLVKFRNDIINKIISYTYNIQSKELLEDIESYYYTKWLLINIYTKKYTRYDWYIDSDQTIDNIYNEVYQYVLNTKLGRLDINKLVEIHYTLKGSNLTKINYIWGLFTVKERRDFFNYPKV